MMKTSYSSRHTVAQAIRRYAASFSFGKYVLLLFAFGTLIVLFRAGIEQSDRTRAIVHSGVVDGFGVTAMRWSLVVARSAAVLGVLSMVLIQSVKAPFREQFHKRSVQRWLLPGNAPEFDAVTYDDLLHLIAPSYSRDIFALPVEQLSAQIASAAEIALSNPTQFRVLALLAGAERYEDVRRFVVLRDAALQGDASADWIQFRNELSHHIQRRIDGWQIHSANRWKTALRLAAVAVSASLALFGTFLSGALLIQPYSSYAFVLTVGLLGGLLASVARDVVAIVEKYRI